MDEYIENPLSGKLRGVTYENGKIIDVHIRDTDDVVKVFVPVRHGRWIDNVDENGFLCNAWRKCSACGGLNYGKKPPYCPNCGSKMDGGDD